MLNLSSAMKIIHKVTEVVDVTDTLQTNMSTDTIVNSENEIKDISIDEEIVDVIEHCEMKDLNKIHFKRILNIFRQGWFREDP